MGFVKSKRYYCTLAVSDFMYVHGTRGGEELFLEVYEEENMTPNAVALTPGDARKLAQDLLRIADFVEGREDE